jgi:hypothetical protein
MNILFWGLTIGTIGKIIVGLAVLRVHMKIFEERKIDSAVLKYIRVEHALTVLGIALIMLGYILEVAFYSGADLFTCASAECAGLLLGAPTIIR